MKIKSFHAVSLRIEFNLYQNYINLNLYRLDIAVFTSEAYIDRALTVTRNYVSL